MFARHFFATPGPSPYTGNNQSDWREWNALCTEWVDTGRHRVGGRDYNADVAAFLETIEMDEDGYVFTYPLSFPHRNRIGWPFPDYRQSMGQYGSWVFAHGSVGGWTAVCGEEQRGGDGGGWLLGERCGEVEVASPLLRVSAEQMPLLAIELRRMDATRGVCFWEAGEQRGGALPFAVPGGRETITVFVPLWKVIPREALITRLRIRFYLPRGAAVELIRVEPLYDTRHNTNNSHFVLAVARHALWGTDRAFLVRNLDRMRMALGFLQGELGGRRLGLLETPWWGHDGQTGLGHGIGSNYWDLLPFGHRDVYGTAYYVGALEAAALVEEVVEAHPEWGSPAPPLGETSTTLRSQADQVRQIANRAFWNEEAGRFVGCIDGTGRPWDFGFVFANLEALYHGLGTPDQATRIYDWLDGRRIVAGDTAQGADIYHWRLAPRATTRRNEDWYTWVWNGRSVPWGQQVQDGGAVLYTSFYDVMNRLRHQGADSGFARLEAVLRWYQEVQEAGGYRSYYQTHEGSLQGAGTAGGIGVDAEFVESALVPLVLLYGFLGVRATPAGLIAEPHLPSSMDWLGVRHIRYADRTYHLSARDGVVTVEDAATGRRVTGKPGQVLVPARWDPSDRA